MIDTIPSNAEIEVMLGEKAYTAWTRLCDFIHTDYDMEVLWNHGGKAGIYECKFRRGGKPLCCTYLREGCFGFMIIYGKVEREKFECQRHSFSSEVQSTYDAANTYHDGKWMMFEISDEHLLEECKSLLHIKRRPKKH